MTAAPCAPTCPPPGQSTQPPTLHLATVPGSFSHLGTLPRLLFTGGTIPEMGSAGPSAPSSAGGSDSGAGLGAGNGEGDPVALDMYLGEAKTLGGRCRQGRSPQTHWHLPGHQHVGRGWGDGVLQQARLQVDTCREAQAHPQSRRGPPLSAQHPATSTQLWEQGGQQVAVPALPLGGGYWEPQTSLPDPNEAPD
ncbi:hypothetical protein P7K49_012135 [Saguinus oedipus]|uniref:Uncharacterized protein n=1 Tax=Saguinus oedipus TaxID=9490 RepID=A0ABQ9VV05_SAGOE|nr:hypothetical protein P7K49_012135 [Saguinus oedipus]